MSNARVSVIIPFSKPEQAQIVLAALCKQTFSAALTEILLVGPNSSSLAAQWAIKAVETQPIYYPGEARNIGARVATGDYFLFLDDDCEPAPDWIEQNVRELERPEVGAVGGQIAGKSKAFFAQCVDFSRFAFSQANKRVEAALCSASLGVKRAAFEQVHGFNEELRSEEDMDFCYRLMKIGYKTIYQPNIKVLHDHRRKSFGVLLRYSYFYGRVSGLYVKRLYPEMSKRNAILSAIQNPLLYPVMMIPVSLGATINIVRTNVKEYPRVLLYAPFIFLSKLASHIGIWRWIIEGHPVQHLSYKQ
jgi:cellulose synthase/poly-beta-1,6-N-acetylglucosamine synthase-like glycosyltransferase